MGAGDLIREAIDELYSVDPDDFTERRTALAAQARAAGEKAAGKEIAALRKPTRAAYTLNQLVRADPDSAPRLAELGAELRAAQESLDGTRMRELSTLRRGMVEELADQAFQVTGQRSPAAGLREEVISTLNAAVADEGVVEQLGSGTLVRAARWDGFGFASPPELSVVRPTGRPSRGEPDRGRSEGKAQRGTATGSDARTRSGTSPDQKSRSGAKAEARTKSAADAKTVADAKAEAEEQRRRQLLAEAKQVVGDTDSALSEAAKAEEEQQTRVRLLHEQLTDARQRLDEIRIDVRRAETRQRKARQALDRLSR